MVARLVWDQEVGSSNLPAPTMHNIQPLGSLPVVSTT